MNKIIMYMLCFTIYTIVFLFWGKNGFKKTNNARDFCVAGNSLGLFTGVFTFTATWFSAVSMQGVTGSVYAYGYSTILYSVVGWLLGASCLVFIAYRIKEYNIVTIPEYFKIRYNSKGYQAFTGLIIVICYILYIIIQIKGFGIVVSTLLDIDYNIAILLIYLFVVYTSFGGLFSVSKTDTLNFILLAAGIFLAAFFIINDIGGITLMHEKAAAIMSKVSPKYNITQGALLDPSANNLFSPLMIITTGLAWGLGTAANPQYIIRITATKDRKTGIQMVCLSAIILGILYVGLMIIGIGSRVLVPEISSINSVDEVLPYIINSKMALNLSGLVFISIIAAAISTANSELLILASSFSYDIYINLSQKQISDEKFLGISRITIFIAGTISLLLSIKPPEILLIYGSYVWSVFAVSFLFPLYGGLYWKKATKDGAIFSSIGGILTIAIFYILEVTGAYSMILHPVFPGLIISCLLFYLVSKATYKKTGDAS